MRRIIYVSCMGGIWRMTERNYNRLLRDAAAGRTWNVDDYGTQLAARTVNITDMTPEDAKEKLGINED